MTSTPGPRGPPASRQATGPPVRAVALALPVIMLPLVLTAVGPWSSATGVAFSAILPVVVAMQYDVRVSLGFALLNPVAVVLGVALNSQPALTTALMAGATVLVALAAGRGLRGPAVYLALEAGLLAVGTVPAVPDEAASTAMRAGACGLVALGAGLVVAGVHRVLLGGLAPSARDRLDCRQTVLYGALLGVLLVPATWLVATYGAGSRAGWVLLTVLIVVRPAPRDTRRVVVHRVAGTLAGGALAALLVLTLPGGDPRVAAGVVCGLVAVALRLRRMRYGLFVTALTPAVVLLGSPTEEHWAADAERVGFTLVAALGVVVVAAAGQAALRWIAGRSPTPPGAPTARGETGTAPTT